MNRSRAASHIAFIGLLLAAEAAQSNPYRLQYGGRITQSNGQPLQGSTSLTAAFYRSSSGGTAVAAQTFTSVSLTDGTFNITVELTPAEFHSVFTGSETWVEITDLTSGKIYPRQRFAAVPYAFKVPIDGTTIGYSNNGLLQVQGLAGQPLPSGSPADGQILKWRSGTGWEWGSDDTGSTPGSITSASIQDGTLSNADISGSAAISGTKISPNFGSQNIVTTGTISGDGSGLTNLPAGPLGGSIDSSEVVDGTLVDADIAPTAAIAQSKISGLSTALAAKEPVITAGTSAQYLRGDKSWATLDTAAVPENTNLYFTDARARAAISGTAPVSYNSTTGAISMAAATSVANGYLSSSDWLTFNNKQAAISAASTVNTGTLTSALQNGVQLKPFGSTAGEAGELRFTEVTGAGSNYVGFKAPDSITADKIWTLPALDGSNGQFLTTDGSGVLSWSSVVGGGGGTVTSITAGTGLSGGTITGNGTIDLANTAVSAGSYTRANITVDAQGRLTAAANGGAVNLGTEVTGTLPLANGGTGSTTASGARTNLGLGSLATASAVVSADITDLTIVDADISASAAIAQSKISGLSTSLAGKEPSITAGTSTQFYRGDKSWVTLDTAAVPENTNLYFTDARARAAISGTAPVSYNSTTGAISMAAATSVANGYLSSSDWLTFNNKQAAISASSTVNTGTLTSALQNGMQLKPFGSTAGEAGELRFTEVTGAGSNYVGFKAPDSITADKIWTLPALDGSNGQFLTTNGSGVLSWSSVAGGGGGTVTSITAGTGLSGGTITGSGTIDLANTAVSAGSYTRANITVDAQGRLTAAADGSAVNLGTEVTGTLPLANGGTGSTTASGARTNLGLGSLATASAVVSADITDLTIVDADISASAAIAQSKISGLSTSLAGKEPSITAGTSAQFYRGDKSWATLDTSAVPENTNLYFTDARARAAISGTAPVSYNSSTGAISMAAATSVANGYLSSSDWLTFNNKQAAISASSTVNTGTLTSALQNGVQLKPFGSTAGEAGELRFTEVTGAGSNYVGFKAPDSITADKIWTLPALDGSNGQFLTTNGSGVLSWSSVAGGGGGTVTSITAGTGLSGGTITGSGTIDLANTAVSAGSYTRANITVDAQGRLTAAANGSAVNLATEVTGTLPLANGGTGSTTASGARTNLGLGSLATASAVASGDITDLTIVDADISASAAIAQSKISGLSTSLAGKEPSITAGTSAQFYRGDKSWATLDTAAVPENTNLYFTDARARASISGTAPVSYNSTTGAISMAAATSIANGYLSSSDWLTFNNKQASISAASTVNTGTLTSALQNGVQLKPFGSTAGEAGELRFTEVTGAGSNFVGFKAPDSITADKIWTLPAADGTSGQILSTDGSGALSWVSPGGTGTVTSITAGTGLSGGTITGSGTINLANTAVSAGSYTRANITVDAQGRLTAAANGSAVSLTADVSGTLPVANGGTGATTASGARTSLGLGSLATASAVASADITDLTIVDADISASAAIAQSKISGLSTSLAGKEPSITAGTSAQFYRGDKSWATLDTAAVPENTNLYFTDARARAAISGTAPVSYNSTTGAISMAAATSVANGYLSSSDWLTFNNKQAAISASSTINTGTLTSALQNGVQLKPFGSTAGEAGELRFTEVTGAGSNFVGFKAPDSITADKIWTLPAADGTSGQILSTNGSGALSWVSPGGTGTVTSITAGTGLSGGTITGSGTINLANTAVSAGSYTRANITVDAQGRLTAAANGSAVSLTADVSGTLPVANGGTGATTASGARTSLGLGSLATASAVASADITDLTIVDADISASAAIAQSKISGLSTSLAGKEPSITAGTSAQFYRGDKSWATLDTAAVPENTNLYFTDARARAAISGTAPVSYNSTTGAISMAAATSVANGYLSSSDWLTFNNKQAAISASSTINTGTLSSALQNGVQLKPFGSTAGEAGELRFTEVTGAGSNFVGFKAPDSITADKIWTLPAADGTSGQFLSTNGSGVLSWTAGNSGTVTSITAGTGLSGGTISGSGTINLANTAVSAGSYTRANITVDAQGRLTAAANGSSVNLASEVTGTLPVGNGGTGLTAGTSGGIPYFSSTSAMATSAALSANGVVLGGGAGAAPTSTAAGTANQALRIPSGGGAPAFGALDISQSAAVTGVLPIANGGTGSSTALNSNRIMVSSSGQIREAAALSNGQLLIGSTGAAPVGANLAQGGNAGVTISNGAGSITLDTAQDIRTTASPTFAGLSLGSGDLKASSFVAGTGDAGTTPVGGTVRAASVSGAANTVGPDLTLTAGNGTGTGGSGSILFQTAPVGTTGSTANTMATRMKIDKTGNIGIGTTAPDTVLEVANGDINAGRGITSTSHSAGYAAVVNLKKMGGVPGSPAALSDAVGGNIAQIQFQGYNGTSVATGSRIESTVEGTWSGTNQGSGIKFWTTPLNSTSIASRVSITSEGNVGIGTSGPTAMLEVQSGSNAQWLMPFKAMAPNNNIAGNTTMMMIGVGATNGNAGNMRFYYAGDNSNDNRMDFAFSSISTPVLSLTRLGYTGIGTSAPTALLDVRGSTAGRVLADDTGLTMRRTWGTATPNITIQRSIGSEGTPGAVGTGANLGQFRFQGYDGTVWDTGALMSSVPTQSWTSTAHGAKLFFQTVPDDSITPATRMTIQQDGNVGIGTVSASGKLHVWGSLCVRAAACASSTNGTIYASSSTVSTADLAENMPVEDETLQPGDVVTLQTSETTFKGIFAKSTKKNQANAVGVVSTSPGVLLGSEAEQSKPIALAGRVPVNVNLEGGPIRVGDYLVASSVPGQAMRARSSADAGIIGIALTPYEGLPIPAKDHGDGIAHEQGHQVMLLVQNGAGSQSAVADLAARADAAEVKLAKLDAESAAAKAAAAQAKAEAASLAKETQALKDWICAQDKKAPFCQK